MLCSAELSGTDSTSAFYGKGKTQPLKIARECEDYCDVRGLLGESLVVEESVVSVIEKYVCHVYGQKGSSTVNDARYKMFKLGKCMEGALPPNFDSLYQYILRVNYEAYIRKRSTTCVTDAPSPVGFEWIF